MVLLAVEGAGIGRGAIVGGGDGSEVPKGHHPAVGNCECHRLGIGRDGHRHWALGSERRRGNVD